MSRSGALKRDRDILEKTEGRHLLGGHRCLVAQGLGCAPAETDPTRIVTRLIAPGDHPNPAAAVFFDTVEVERWEFNSDEDLARWTSERIDSTFEVNEDGLLIESTSTDPTILREVILRW